MSNSKLKEKMEQLKEQNKNYENRIIELDEQVKNLKKIIRAAMKEIDKLKANNRELTQQVETLKNEPKNEISRLKAEIDDLKQEKINTINNQAAFQNLQKNTAQLKNYINNLSIKLKSKNGDDDQLKDIVIERLKKRIKDLSSNEMQIKSRNIFDSNELNEYKKQNKELNRKMKALKNFDSTTARRFLDLIPKFKDKMNEIDKKKEQNKKLIKAKKEEIEYLKQENLKLKAALQDVHDDTSQLEDSINDLSTELNSKNEDDQLKLITIERLKKRITDLMSNLQEDKKEKSANNDNIVCIQELIDIKSDLDYISQELDRIQEENSIKDVLIEQLKNRIDELR